jgi:cation diffusion facilitator family transporter
MKEQISLVSIFINLILTFGKIIIGTFAKSASVLADGIHSSMDVISSVISFFGIKIAKKPVDEKHPYGHYKFEVLSGLIITLLLFFAGIWMIYEAYKGFINPEIISLSYLALGIMTLSVILNTIMSKLKIYYGKKENSLSLLSDGVHDKADVFASLAVLIGLVIMPFWVYIDSILALLIGLYIIKESFSLGKEATDSLLDVSAGKEIEDKMREIIKQNNIQVSDLKTQKKGSIITANIEIELPNKTSVEEATKISNSLKERLVREIVTLEYVAIQIKSHDMTDSYFKPKDLFSKVISQKSYGWQRKGKFKDTIKEAQGKGPEGYCLCPKCGYKQKHKRGTPCSIIKCPKCNTSLVRE